MASTANRLQRTPNLAIVRALVSRSPLLPLEHSWLADRSNNEDYGAMMLNGDFWHPVKELRLVPCESVADIERRLGKAKAILSMTILWASIIGIGKAIEPFEWFSSYNEHFSLNVLGIATAPIFITAIFILRHEMKPIKALPIAQLSEDIRANIRVINATFWTFIVATSVFTAILAFVEASVALDDKGNQAVESVRTTSETLTEEGPNLIARAASASDLGSNSVVTILGLGVVRIVFGLGLTVGTTVLILTGLSLSREITPFLIALAATYGLSIFWLRRILKS